MTWTAPGVDPFVVAAALRQAAAGLRTGAERLRHGAGMTMPNPAEPWFLTQASILAKPGVNRPYRDAVASFALETAASMLEAEAARLLDPDEV